MSYAEAVEDNILIRRGGKGYSCSYYPPCHICGTPTYSLNYIRGRKYTCVNCKTHAALSTLLKQDRRAIEKNTPLVPLSAAQFPLTRCQECGRNIL